MSCIYLVYTVLHLRQLFDCHIWKASHLEGVTFAPPLVRLFCLILAFLDHCVNTQEELSFIVGDRRCNSPELRRHSLDWLDFTALAEKADSHISF